MENKRIKDHVCSTYTRVKKMDGMDIDKKNDTICIRYSVIFLWIWMEGLDGNFILLLSLVEIFYFTIW